MTGPWKSLPGMMDWTIEHLVRGPLFCGLRGVPRTPHGPVPGLAPPPANGSSSLKQSRGFQGAVKSPLDQIQTAGSTTRLLSVDGR